MENRKLTPRRIHTAISSLHGQMRFTNSFTSDNNREQNSYLNCQTWGRLTLVTFFWFWGQHTISHHITWLSVMLDSHWLAHQVTGRRASWRNTVLRLA